MVGFLIPIPGKVVEGVYNGGANFVKSYKKDAPPTDLGPNADERYGAPAPPPPRSSNNYSSNRWDQGSSSAAVLPPPGRGAGRPAPARAAAPARNMTSNNAPGMEAFGTQLLTHIFDSISLLESMGQITPQAARSATAALEGAGSGGGYDVPAPAPAPAPVTRAAPSNPAPSPGESRATALWDYGQSGDSSDLTFSEGDTVIIDEEVNDEWYRGRTIPKGRTAPLPTSGLFPSSYVQRQ